MDQLLQKDNPSQQVTTLWYRLIASQGQSAEATAGESSLLLNRPMRAVAVAPMGCAMDELLQKDNPSQQATTLWYRLIASQGQSAEAAAGESSLLLNRPMCAVAVAPKASLPHPKNSLKRSPIALFSLLSALRFDEILCQKEAENTSTDTWYGFCQCSWRQRKTYKVIFLYPCLISFSLLLALHINNLFPTNNCEKQTLKFIKPEKS